MYMDGQAKTAFWKYSGGMLDDKPASQGGVDPSLAARTARSQTGSLVLGQVRLAFDSAVVALLVCGASLLLCEPTWQEEVFAHVRNCGSSSMRLACS
jgi:hypothetical protein